MPPKLDVALMRKISSDWISVIITIPKDKSLTLGADLNGFVGKIRDDTADWVWNSQ